MNFVLFSQLFGTSKTILKSKVKGKKQDAVNLTFSEIQVKRLKNLNTLWLHKNLIHFMIHL